MGKGQSLQMLARMPTLAASRPAAVACVLANRQRACALPVGINLSADLAGQVEFSG
jgi:hypothetical protein